MEATDINLKELVKELLDFLEENNVSDENFISWLSNEDCYIESKRSPEMIDLLQRVSEVLEE